MARLDESTLLGIPIELLCMITDLLELDSFRYFRQTCRHVRLASEHSFKKYFKVQKCSSELRTLERLYAMGRGSSPGLISAAKQLFIESGILDKNLRIILTPFDECHDLDGTVGDASPETRMLESLLGLPNLESICLTDNYVTGYVWDDTRKADIEKPFGSVSTSGLLRMMERIPQRLKTLRLEEHYWEKYATRSRSHAHRQEHPLLHDRGFKSRYSPGSILLEDAANLNPDIFRALNRLEFHLRVWRSGTQHYNWGHMTKMFAAAINLRTLEIDLSDGLFHLLRSEPYPKILKGSRDIVSSLTGVASHRWLKSLSLSTMETQQESLVKLLMDFRDTIRHLSMKYCRIFPGSWIEVFTWIRDNLALEEVKFSHNLGPDSRIACVMWPEWQMEFVCRESPANVVGLDDDVYVVVYLVPDHGRRFEEIVEKRGFKTALKDFIRALGNGGAWAQCHRDLMIDFS